MVIVARIKIWGIYFSRNDSFTVKVIKRLTRIKRKNFVGDKRFLENSESLTFFIKRRLLKKVRR